MTINEAYTMSEGGFDEPSKSNDVEKVTSSIATRSQTTAISYSYDEAISLAGNGIYNIGLLATTSVAIIAMAIDMFGFSIVVNGSSCDFQLDMMQKSIILSMPFLGPVFMSYPWGYISDTRGRKLSLHVAYWGGFILSTLSAFSPNWIVLAVLRFMSTSLCSCGQSSTYTLLGESCGVKVRGAYMLIMTSVLNFGFAAYMTMAYFFLNLDIYFDLGFITFTQWRLLTIVLALPLGITAVSLHFYHESPKFLLNAGHEDLALDILRKIWHRNGGEVDKYPVNKVILNEDGNTRNKDIPFLKSLWNQTAPLFKPPLLSRTMQLFYLTTVVYSISSSFIIWFPFLVQSLVKELTSTDNVDQVHGLCNMITNPQINDVANITSNVVECTTKMQPIVVYSALLQGVIVVSANLAISKLSSRKKLLMIIILLISGVTSFGAVIVSNNVVSFILFFGQLSNTLVIGLVFSYYVDIYPTSYRGMVSCLGVMISRFSGLAGVNIVGSYIISNCTVTFYSCAAFTISGAIVACFLPPDKPKKSV